MLEEKKKKKKIKISVKCRIQWNSIQLLHRSSSIEGIQLNGLGSLPVGNSSRVVRLGGENCSPPPALGYQQKGKHLRKMDTQDPLEMRLHLFCGNRKLIWFVYRSDT